VAGPGSASVEAHGPEDDVAAAEYLQ
jgi:hypothetical protein